MAYDLSVLEDVLLGVDAVAELSEELGADVDELDGLLEDPFDPLEEPFRA